MDKNRFLNSFGLGYRLGRVEFLWDTKFRFAKKAFKEAREELNSILLMDGLKNNAKDFKLYSKNIFNYYSRDDKNIKNAIMVGIGAYRYVIANSDVSDQNSVELLDLADSALDEVSSDFCDNREELKKILLDNVSLNLNNLDSLVYDFLFRDITIVDKDINKNERYVFISYCTEDEKLARKVKSVLEQNGYRTWFAPDNIKYGSSYAESIEDAISYSSCFLALLTDRSIKSRWVEKEIDRAVNHGTIIIPVIVDDITLPKSFSFYLTNNQFCRITSMDKSSFEHQIIEIINSIDSLL
ncbi:toll/interleukin-1 receptor domain-containing protein [Mycoplasmatota bacterium]|nr:toll/interleukin-1 receptor domain-containing protein [Mycoplasmatota bacterium]